jgi:hypothetical protein
MHYSFTRSVNRIGQQKQIDNRLWLAVDARLLNKPWRKAAANTKRIHSLRSITNGKGQTGIALLLRPHRQPIFME